jgi:hypothetical protein
MGKMTGDGVLTKKNGDVYTGAFLNGRYHGPGILVKKDGKRNNGMWANGKLVKIITEASQNVEEESGEEGAVGEE